MPVVAKRWLVVERREVRNKTLYKVFLVILKYIPVFVTLTYILNSILCIINIDIPVLSNIAGMSLSTWVFMYIATFVFRFCIYHRLLLYYILTADLVNITDYYIGLPLEDMGLISLNLSLVGVLIIALLANHVRSYKRDSA